MNVIELEVVLPLLECRVVILNPRRPLREDNAVDAQQMAQAARGSVAIGVELETPHRGIIHADEISLGGRREAGGHHCGEHKGMLRR